MKIELVRFEDGLADFEIGDLTARCNVSAWDLNEFLNGELFVNLYEAQVLAKRWRDYYNNIRPHGSLSGRPPAPQSILLTA